MRALASLLFAVGAIGCSAPEAPPPAAPAVESSPAPTTEADDIESRGTVAGLAPAQTSQMAGYEFGAVVPQLPPGWRLAAYRDETVAEAVTYPGYHLQYVHDDGRCFNIMAASEGLGDVFVIEPPNVTEADVPGVALFGTVPIGWSGPEEAGDWGPDRLSTEWFGTDALFVLLSSATEDGCRVISAETATEILSGMRYLDPADDAALPGRWEFVDVYPPESGPPQPQSDPEAHALSTFAAAAEEGTTSSVRTLRAGPHVHVVLVTSEGLADDSIRDERTRVTYTRDMDGGWLPQYAGRQRRCREGRGHQEWSPEACV